MVLITSASKSHRNYQFIQAIEITSTPQKSIKIQVCSKELYRLQVLRNGIWNIWVNDYRCEEYE